MESTMQQTKEKKKERDMHEWDSETELLKNKEKQIQRLDQQPSSHEKNAQGFRNGKNLSMTKLHIAK